MIAAFDVHYFGDGGACTAAVLFSDYVDQTPKVEYVDIIYKVEDYIPGEFYKRELPCILKLVEKIKVPLNELIIDGYVMLGDKPGLGQYLYDSLDRKFPVIGVAKSRFKGAKGAEVFRGKSKKPLYITTAGMGLQEAYEKIRMMHGNYRIPTLLRRVDLLTKKAPNKIFTSKY